MAAIDPGNVQCDVTCSSRSLASLLHASINEVQPHGSLARTARRPEKLVGEAVLTIMASRGVAAEGCM